MWIPKSAAEVEAAAQRGDLEETHTFDAKVALPVPSKNRDLAVDVCAMTVDGGSLIYGLGEDEHQRLRVLSPIGLTGADERVAQIVETSIHEPPFIRLQGLPTDADPSSGYLLVVVPQSARAPHQVVSGGDMRYYGRGAKGNRILSEREIAGLYDRRERWEVDREKLLESELARAPDPDPELGYAVAFARPVVPDDEMIERVASGGQELRELMLQGARSWGDVRADRHGRSYAPDLRGATSVWQRGVEGWTFSTSHQRNGEARDTAKIDIDFDGTGRFFCGRVADTTHDRRQFVFFEAILAGNLASFFAAMGGVYEASGYVGHVDVGMAVTGIEGAAPYGLHHWGDITFSGPVPKRTSRVTAAELRDAAPGVALGLIGRLLQAMRGTSYDPFEAAAPVESTTA